MKNITKFILFAAGALTLASCSGFLETGNPGIVDKEFVFSSPGNAKAAMMNVYSKWKDIEYKSHQEGYMYILDGPGSDDTRHPELYAKVPQRHQPEGLFENGATVGAWNIDNIKTFSSYYAGIAAANNIINAMAATEEFKEYMKKSEPTELSQLYGEAICAKATFYMLLIRYYGDIPYVSESGKSASGMNSRDEIYDKLIAELETVIPHMYRVGQVPSYGNSKAYFSRTYAETLLGTICMDAAGYQTRRADFNYVDGNGKAISFEKLGKPNASADNAFYGRRSDYKTLVEKAEKAFAAVIENSGISVFHTTDPRSKSSTGQEFNNPFQYCFQQMMDDDFGYADESILEIPFTQNYETSPFGYNVCRPSNGGSTNAFPGKVYCQVRVSPAWYFGVFDPKDMRRDVSCCVTGSSGGGAELLIPFTPNAKSSGGGICVNKWDENRQKKPSVLKYRQSGINSPFFRLSHAYLGYAEACALLGKDGEAKNALKTIRERAFPAGQANVDGFISECGSMFKAVIKERAFEFLGEGDRRWTLIRTGLLPESVKSLKTLQAKMIDGINTNGYFTFENGNQISAYVWTKTVNAKATYKHRLTCQTPVGKEDDPVLFPGWRGQNDDWLKAAETAGCTVTTAYKAGDMTNLAIKGLFKYIDPAGTEAAALEGEGYKKVNYGIELVTNRAEFVDNFFKDYDYESAPMYIIPFDQNSLRTINGLTNGYGFKNL